MVGLHTFLEALGFQEGADRGLASASAYTGAWPTCNRNVGDRRMVDVFRSRGDGQGRSGQHGGQQQGVHPVATACEQTIRAHLNAPPG